AGARGTNWHHEQFPFFGAVLWSCLCVSLCALKPFLEPGPSALRCALRHSCLDCDLGRGLLAVGAVLRQELVLGNHRSAHLCHRWHYTTSTLDDARDLEHQDDGTDAHKHAHGCDADLRRDLRHPVAWRAAVASNSDRDLGCRSRCSCGGVEPTGIRAYLATVGHRIATRCLADPRHWSHRHEI